MAKIETIKKNFEKALAQLEGHRGEWNQNHRTAFIRAEQAIQALDRVIKDEEIQALQGKEYFEATTPVTGKTELKKAND